MASRHKARLAELKKRMDTSMTNESEWRWREFVYRELTDDELQHIINSGDKANDDPSLMDNPAWRDVNLSQEEERALSRWAELTLQAGLA